jgi:inosine/xanthosine triphosphatase
MGQVVVAVGSTRKPKLVAVHQALQQIAGLLNAEAQFTVVPVEVESGVAHTPASREVMMEGARLRAEALQEVARQKSEGWDFFVGLEGGLDVVRSEEVQRVFLESWAYVSDGKSGHFGRSGAVEVPEALAREVLERGIELSVAIDEFAQQTGIRDAQGAWGVLSANQITRQEAFRVAVIAAFAPFYNARMYGNGKLKMGIGK